MGEQRRRGGRGRSGRGGRIPKKGDGPATTAQHEAFVSFPLELTGPLRVPSVIDEQAVEAAIGRAIEVDRRQGAALQAILEASADAAVAAVREEIEQDREALEALARDLGAEIPSPEANDGSAGDLFELVARQRVSRLSWALLQQAAYASGDKRIERVVRPALRAKERQSSVLEAYAVREAARAFFVEPAE